MTTRIPAWDERLAYRGAVSLQRLPGGVAPWRVPHEQARLFLPRGGLGRGAMPSGVRVAFRTDSPWLRCGYRALPPPKLVGPQETARLDVLAGGALVARVELDTAADEATFTVPELPVAKPQPSRESMPVGGPDSGGPDSSCSGSSGSGSGSNGSGSDGLCAVELWLPYFSQFTLGWLEVAGGARLEPPEPCQAPRWVHYGSSISQGRGAEGPSRIWPALLARDAGLDLTSVSMGAACHIQPAFASLVAGLRPDLATACLGVNPHYFGSLNEHSYQPAVIGFVRTVRERNPSTSVVVMSTIHSPEREDRPGRAGLTLAQYREETAAAVALLRDHGDELVHYVDGLTLFGPDDAHLMLEPPDIDRIHLGPAGHELFGRRLLEALAGLGVVKGAVGTSVDGTSGSSGAGGASGASGEAG